MPFVATWIDLEIIILSEVNQRQISYDIIYMWDIKKIIQMNLFTKQKEVYKHAKHTYGYWRRKGSGGYRIEGWD